MRIFATVGVASILVLGMSACTSLLGDFQAGGDGGGAQGDSTADGSGSDAQGDSPADGGGSDTGGDSTTDGAGGDARGDSTTDGGASADSSGGSDVAQDASSDTGGNPLDQYVAPDHVVPPPDAGMEASTPHGNGTFQPATDFMTGATTAAASGLLVADLTHDGVDDLAACTGVGIAVYATVAGVFKAQETSDNTASGCIGIAAFDLENNGYPYLAVLQNSPAQIAVFTNQQGVNYYIQDPNQTYLVLPLAAAPRSIASDDFNQDLFTDVAITSADGAVHLYENLYPKGTPGIGLLSSVMTSESPGKLLFQDFNGDKVADLAVGAVAYDAYAMKATPTAAPYFGGASALRYAYNPPFSVNLSEVTSGDFDDDGKVDVATADQGTNDLTIFFNQGSNPGDNYLNFASASQTSDPPHVGIGGLAPNDIASGDFNGDHRADLVVAVAGAQLEVILSGPGRTFAAPVPIMLEDTASSVVVGDFNADHKLDIAVLYVTKAAVGVLYGN
jgi:hypothetical protein